MPYLIYTDGSIDITSGIGGYAALIFDGQNEYYIYGSYKNTTGNRMELTAVLKALESIKDVSDIKIVSDSKYVVDSMLYNRPLKWIYNQSNRPNADLWERMLLFNKVHNLTFQWVKGHSDNPINNKVDELAGKSRLNSINLEIDNNGTCQRKLKKLYLKYTTINHALKGDFNGLQ